MRACRGGERLRPLRRGKGGRHRLFHHRHVDVGPEHECLAPEAHRAGGIELLRLAEGALRLAVIEAVGKYQALIEIGLRLCARRRDLVGQRAEAAPDRRIGIGKRQSGGCSVQARLRSLGRRRSHADPAAARPGGRYWTAAKDEIQIHRRSGICRGGLGRCRSRPFEDRPTFEGEQRDTACHRSGTRDSNRHAHETRLHDVLQPLRAQRASMRATGPLKWTLLRFLRVSLSAASVVFASPTGTRPHAVPRSTCARTA